MHCAVNVGQTRKEKGWYSYHYNKIIYTIIIIVITGTVEFSQGCYTDEGGRQRGNIHFSLRLVCLCWPEVNSKSSLGGPGPFIAILAPTIAG